MSRARVLLVLAALALTSCDWDRDGVDRADDCDDRDASTYPGAPELCDGVDNDCDGAIDEDGMDGWYVDRDSDGYGDSDAVPTCEATTDRTTRTGDCDDANADVNPDATEVCDGQDNDCDGRVDALPPSLGETALLGTELMLVTGTLSGDSAGHQVAGVGDVDGDGLDDVIVGVPGDSTELALPGEAWVVSDGQVIAILVGEDAGDGAAYAVAPAGDQDGDGLADVLVSATQHVDTDAEGAVVEGAVYVVTAPLSGEISLGESAGRIVGSGVGDGFGWSIAGGGDVDGDGIDDVLVGAWAQDGEDQPLAGAVGIFYGPVLETRHWADADAWLLGDDAADAAGWSVAFAGDTDGDGTDDVLIGAIGHDGGGAEAGAVYLVRGPIAGEILLRDADAVLTGEADFASTGTSVAGAGDVDGDGLADLLIGAPGLDRAYVVLSPVDGDLELGLADAVILGNGTSADTGFSVAGLGDLDGDGLGDVLIGAPAGATGGAYLFSGPTTGSLSLDDASVALRGGPGALAGFSVAAAGDVDGDGVADLVIGALRDDLGGRNAGAAYLVPGADVAARYLGRDYFADADGDGHGDPDTTVQACGAGPGALDDADDCDDGDATRHPGAEELCDTRDNDCDDTIDEAPADCAADPIDDPIDQPIDDPIDGPEEDPVDAPDEDPVDAPDEDPDDAPEEDPEDEEPTDTGPIAEEDPPEDTGLPADEEPVDEEPVDEEPEPDPCVLLTWYSDADSDGHGDPGAPIEACEQPAGTVETATDCDDTEPDAYDGAIEQCDGVDNDCDGRIDRIPADLDPVEGLALAELVITGDRWGQDAGHALSTVGDLDGDGLDDLAVGAPGEDGEAGAVYVFYAPLLGDVDLDEADAVLRGDVPGGWAGYTLAGLGDVDGDGFDDLAIGAPNRRTFAADGWHEGAVFVVYGPISGEVDLGAADAVLVGERRGDFAGVSVAAAGDVNGDGLQDLIVGASEADPNGPASGAAYVIYGPITGQILLGDADAAIRGDAPLLLLGHAVTGVGDTDGDGYDDVLIGAWGDDTAHADAGAALLFRGPLSGDLDPSDADVVFTGASEGALAGYALASAGDVNGDGLDDLLIGAPGTEDATQGNTGAAHLVLAPFTGAVDLALSDATYIGDEQGPVGYVLAGGADFDGDGSLDLALGTPGRENSRNRGRAGAAHLFYGTPLGVRSTDEADLSLEGSLSDDNVGWSVAWMDDLDGDGGPDLVIGAPGLAEGGGVVVITGAIHDDVSLTTTWYIDADGDGYGDDGTGVESCDAPSGRVAAGGDCDDTDPSLAPDAPEYCDGVDQDCDGDVDEGEAVDAPRWWLDRDRDGYAGALASRVLCSQPEDGHEEVLDCDDRDDTVHPDAEEVCDLVDNDCDSLVDEDYGDTFQAFHPDADADGYGDPALSVDACMAPAGTVRNDGDCDDSDRAISPDADELCDGIDNDCDGTADEDDAVDATRFYTDADGDGWGDPDTRVIACTPPSGAVALSEDCDDSDASVSPGAGELCHDAVDNDCDDAIDEATAVDVGIWYRDGDADGYGDPDRWTAACDLPDGYTTDTSDCDDRSAASHPGGTEVCDGDDNDCDGTVDEDARDTTGWYLDGDSDGYGTGAEVQACERPVGHAAIDGDCDDAHSEAYPGAEEICDGLDGDCDGTVDEGAGTAWYADTDGDTYGDPRDSVDACEAPAGYVVNRTDCDDGAAEVHPNAPETCGDGLDSDCDDTDDDDDAIDAIAWYLDEDGDGYGASRDPIMACVQPSGTVANSEDCKDKDASVNPLGTEVCDAVDNDCDGTVDEGSATDATVYYSDLDGDGWGDAESVITACALPAEASETAGDCDDDARTVNPDARDYCGDDVDSDCDGREAGCGLDGTTWLSGAEAVLSGEGDSYEAGTSVAGAGDLDGDGHGDFIVGSPGYKRVTADDGTYKSGTSYVVYGPVSGSQALGAAGLRRYGQDRYDKIGQAVAGLGDVDGDGLDEAVVGAPYDSTADNKAGAVYLITSAPTGHGLISSGSVRWTGEAGNDRAGNAVAGAGDVDGDGSADVLVGVERLGLGGSKAGAAYLLTNPTAGGSLSGASAVLVGEDRYHYAGHSVAGAGDVDGDGFDDLLVGAPGTDDGGAAYLVLGPVSGTVPLSGADATWVAEDMGDDAGTVVASLGDLDGDGLDDFAIGAPGATGGALASGVVYVVTDLTGGLLRDESWRIDGAERYDGAGAAVLGPGDLDGDGHRDLVIGAPEAESGAGRVFVLLAPTAGAADLAEADGWHEGGAGDAAGTSLGASDVDGDGLPDLLLGGSGEDSGGDSAGAVWILSDGGL